jgi:hypothetical protein
MPRASVTISATRTNCAKMRHASGSGGGWEREGGGITRPGSWNQASCRIFSPYQRRFGGIGLPGILIIPQLDIILQLENLAQQVREDFRLSI